MNSRAEPGEDPYKKIGDEIEQMKEKIINAKNLMSDGIENEADRRAVSLRDFYNHQSDTESSDEEQETIKQADDDNKERNRFMYAN